MNCKICNSNNISKNHIGDVAVFNCKNCGIVYLSQFPSIDNITKLYTDEYLISNKSEITEIRRISQAAEQYFLIKSIEKYKCNYSSLVDIGCDKGLFLDEIRRNGFDTFGVELSKSSVKYCRNIGLKVENNIADFSRKFDVITMNHSLEHFTEPLNEIINLRNFLNPEGILLVRVPAFDSVWAKILSKRWIWFQAEHHYFHYSIQSLQKLLELSGFEVKEIYHRRPSAILSYFNSIITQLSFAKNNVGKFNVSFLIKQIIKNLTAVEIFVIAQIRD